MLDLHEMLPCGELRVLEGVVRRGQAVHGHALRLQRELDPFDLACARPTGDGLLERLPVRQPRVVRRKLSIASKRADRAAQPCPLLTVRGRDRHPTVVAGGREHAVRREVERGVAAAFEDVAVHGVVEDGRAEEVRRGLALREVDVLAHAGAPAVIERQRAIAAAVNFGAM